MYSKAKWHLYKDGKYWTIRKFQSGKYARYPKKEYRHLLDDEDELKRFVFRLNIIQNTREAIEIRHSYITPELLDEYLAQLMLEIPNEKNAKTEYFFLRKYFLNYFITIRQLSNPMDWHREHETTWAAYLLSPEVPASKCTKTRIINAANRFMRFVHKRMPEVPILVFTPIPKARMKLIEGSREVSGEKRVTRYISDEDWARIMELPDKALSPEVKACAQLAYAFGLRRSETLGLRSEDVMRQSLHVRRQLRGVGPVYGPLKSRRQRKVPYWFVGPRQTHAWVEKKIDMHPDSLGHLWAAAMRKLGFKYTFHDIRHTWVTNSLRVDGVKGRDVQLAAGHTNIEITMRYAKDDRGLDNNDVPWTPDAPVAQLVEQ